MDEINIIPVKRYYDLDALRGVAAIAVLLGHAKGFGILPIEWLNHTYIAVDFFFCLSGFVIVAAYKDKLISRKITITDFFVIRIIRFMPMLFVSGFLTFFICMVLFLKQKINLFEVFLNTVSNVVLIPISGIVDEVNKTFEIDNYLFHINPLLWSLFYEIIVNLLLALIFIRSKKIIKILIVIVVVSYLLLFFRFSSFDVGAKSDFESIFYGFLRSFLDIALGGLLYFCKEYFLSLRFYNLLLPFGYFILCLTLFLPQFFISIVNPLILFLIFPFVILSCTNFNEGFGLIKEIKILLGDISLPLYIIHYPVLLIVQPFIKNEKIGCLLILFCIVLSAFVARFVDSPVRIHLKSLQSEISV